MSIQAQAQAPLPIQLSPIMVSTSQDLTTLPHHILPRSSSSVFDRLYSTSTESSRSRKLTVSKENENKDNSSASNFVASNKKVPPIRNSRPVLKSRSNGIRSHVNSQSSDVYNRLYSTGTKSYNSKRKIDSPQSQNKPGSDRNKTLAFK